MSKTYVNGVKLIKRPNKFFKKLWKLVVFIVICVVVFFGGIGLSSLITNNSFSWTIGEKISLKGINYYAIHFGEFDNKQEAIDCSVWTASSGGAAYIYEGNTYIVLGQIYANIDDANKVVENFNQDLTYEPAIKQFKTKKQSFSVKNISKKDKRKIIDNINLISDTVNKLLIISNNLDKSLCSNVSASSEVNSLKSDVKIAKMELTSLNIDYNSGNILKIINLMIVLEDSLDVCTTKLLNSENYSNACKYCACELFFNFYDFCNGI